MDQTLVLNKDELNLIEEALDNLDCYESDKQTERVHKLLLYIQNKIKNASEAQ